MRTLKKAVPLVAAAGLLLAFVGVAPANARSSPLITVYLNDGTMAASAQYKDATDQLCVTNYQYPRSAEYAYAKIRRTDGTIFKQVAGLVQAGWICTGNLSIVEDKLYELVLTEAIDGGKTKVVDFYS